MLLLVAVLAPLSVQAAPFEITIPGGTSRVTLNQAGVLYRLTGDLTTPGQAVRITASNVTLDLNGYTITYNVAPSTSRVRGIETAVFADNITIRNGTIVQGAGATASSPAVFLTGSTRTPGRFFVYDLVIRTVGFQSNGIMNSQGYKFTGSQIYHNYIEVLGGTAALDGSGADPIYVSGGGTTAGISIHDNVLVNGHRGMQVIYGGTTSATTERSYIYGNRIQHKRSPGSKAPYGILLAKADNFDIYENQIVSDEGRGIIIDGWSNGTSNGATGNRVFRNRIDVQYSSVATAGGYVENNIYGIRDRYSSGDNAFGNNVVMVANGISGGIDGFFIGSDSADPYMTNLVVSNNTVIARNGGISSNRPVAFAFSATTEARLLDNQYLAATFLSGAGAVISLTDSGNTIFAPPASTPTEPTGLQIRRFLDSYLLSWNDNAQADVLEYVVYRDGVRLPISTRGGTFYVDQGIGGTHTYAVSAVNLSGTESGPSAEVSTETASIGWN
jgi:hypothetical protein